MNTRTKRIVMSMASLVAIWIVAAVTGAPELHAQRFQYTYGDSTCREAGRGGVRQLTTSTGGYITVGESFSPHTGCTSSDVYAVETNAAGAQVWSLTYDIGGNDSATDIEQCSDGGFIVCGVTNNAPPTTCGGARDIFLLKLTGTGGVSWVRKYGSADDEIGWDVVVTTTGDGTTTHPGDFVVAGSSTHIPGIGPRDAYLFRTTSTGALIWDVKYHDNGDDYFYGVDEATFGVPATQAGDIIAVGGTTSYNTRRDLLIVRVNGNTGLAGAAPQSYIYYTGNNDKEAYSVQELAIGADAGNIIVAGYTTTGGGTDKEVYLLKTMPYPFFRLADVNIVNGNGDDEGRSVREITSTVGGLTPGNLIVTGYIKDYFLGGFGGKDAFLQDFTPALARASLQVSLFGGTADDEGWSVGVASNTSPTSQTAGYIVSGYTRSPDLIGIRDIEQLYLFKTDVARNSDCHYVQHDVYVNTPNLPSTSASFTTSSINVQCNTSTTSTDRQWEHQLCYIFPATRQGNGNGGNDGVAGTVANAAPGNAGYAIESYPNPVERGTAINLEYTLTRASSATVAVTDAAGHSVYNLTGTFDAGTHSLPVSTGGWADGAYFVTITIDGNAITKKIIVKESE